MSNERRKPFPFDQFEPRWQRVWDERQTFHVPNPGEPGFDAGRPKFYVLDMFPYPSGAGLHVGHPEGYTATDIIGRYKKMRGFNVLHPMGWDAFGLPAEQHAIKTGEHPAANTARNIAIFKRQLQAIGFGYDWQREVNTTDPGYFKWTQWIFLQLYNSYYDSSLNKAMPIALLEDALSEQPTRQHEWASSKFVCETREWAIFPKWDAARMAQVRDDFLDTHRLAYVSHARVNWCPELGTVLANEEVIDGKSEVGGHPVERRPMRQWMLRITAYAQRLMDELDGLDWPESIKIHQRNWIGRSEGAEVEFFISEAADKSGLAEGEIDSGSEPPKMSICVFTTRPDTLYGATYLVLAPEHMLVDDLVSRNGPHRSKVQAYKKQCASKSDIERAELTKDKTGVFTGAFAINPVNGERIPIWIADYVLTGYGTGAIMAVPAHDERDWEFAKKFALPIREVVSPEPRLGLGGSGVCDAEPLECFTGEAYAIHSGPLDGLPTAAAKAEIIRRLEAEGLGKKTINFKLRDWLFSRQRYWGEPFPIVWESGPDGQRRHRALDASELPVVPPDLTDFKPTGTPEPPLSKATDWVRYSATATRELNTMPQWAGSCWYYLRFIDNKNAAQFVGREAEAYWMGAASGTELEVRRQLRELFELADNRDRGPVPLRAVLIRRVADAEAAALSAATGMNLTGFAHFADTHAIRHIIKEHGDAEAEAERGQLPITADDIAMIPDILAHPDTVRAGHPTGRKRPAILYSKEVNGWTIYVEEVVASQRRLIAKTMYKKVAAGKRATAGAGVAHTSETFRRAKQNLSSESPAVKPGGVDLYVGGTEHAVLHLLYARFWHKVLFDLGHVSTPEPFQRLVNQGLILGEDGHKMSKSRGNVVNPDEVIRDYGADSLRLYEMFMGPLEASKPWSMSGVEGVFRFLARVWRLVMEENQAGEWQRSAAVQDVPMEKPLAKVVHATVKKVGEDIEALSFNTAIAQMMVCTNALVASTPRPVAAIRLLLQVLNPFAPHLSEELNAVLAEQKQRPTSNVQRPTSNEGRADEGVALNVGRSHPLLADTAWPAYDPGLLIEDEIELPVQVNGKLREKIVVNKDATQAEIEAAAKSAPKVAEALAGKTVMKLIVVPGRLVNIVIG